MIYPPTHGRRFDPNFKRIDNRPEALLPRDTEDEAALIEELEELQEAEDEERLDA
jgi:hypothetical protein